MKAGKKGAVAKEVLGFGVLAVIFFQLSLFLLIFVIPLVILFRRRGFLPGLEGCLLALGGIAGIKIFQMSRIAGAFARPDLFGIDLVVPGSFLLGLLVIEAPMLINIRLYQRLLLATGIAVLASLPLVLFVATNPEFDAILRYQIQAMIKSIQGGEAIGPEGQGAAAIVDQVARLSKQVFLYTYTAGYLLTLGGNWLIGAKLGLKTLASEEGVGKIPSFANFKVPEVMIWWFLVSWSGVLLGFVVNLGFAKTLLWNSALIVTILYGCQGLGIIKFWMGKMGKGTKMAFTFFIVFFAFIPGINVLLAVGVPLLGVTELWIQYRNKERS